MKPLWPIWSSFLAGLMFRYLPNPQLQVDVCGATRSDDASSCMCLQSRVIREMSIMHKAALIPNTSLGAAALQFTVPWQ